MSEPSRRTLVLVAHPALPLSKPDRALVDVAETMDDVTVRDLYSRYQSHPINVPAERALAAAADDIVVHFPVLHHHEPPLLQQWMQRVFDPAWYMASGADVLYSGTGLRVTTVVEDSGSSPAVRRLQRWRVEEQSLFLKQWAHRLGMLWRAPAVLPVPPHAGSVELESLQQTYRHVLTAADDAAGDPARRQGRPLRPIERTVSDATR